MVARLVFGMTCGEWNGLLRQLFRSCITLLALVMLVWLIISSSLMAPFCGTLILLQRRIIGRWNFFPC
jgi:hypothetical protein